MKIYINADSNSEEDSKLVQGLKRIKSYGSYGADYDEALNVAIDILQNKQTYSGLNEYSDNPLSYETTVKCLWDLQYKIGNDVDSAILAMASDTVAANKHSKIFKADADTARTLTFQVIASSDQYDDIESKIKHMITSIEMNLYDLSDDIYYNVGEPYYVEFPDGTEQYRADFEVQKNTRKVSWNDIMRAVNKVYAPKYDYKTLTKLY